MEHCSLSRVAIGECLVPEMKSSFLWITDVEVTQYNAHPIGIRRPVRVNKMQPAALSSKSKFRFEMNVDNNKVVSLGLYFPKVVTALTSKQMCHSSFFK